jgi:hypothetical protein
MLKEKQKNTPYVGIFKLSTGEEIIANVLEDSLLSFQIKNPLCMVPTQKGYQFAPWLMMADAGKSLSLNKSLVVANTTAVVELEGQFESVTTGIALPQKSSIIT